MHEHELFDRTKLRIRPLAEREHLLTRRDILPLHEAPPPLPSKEKEKLAEVAQAIRMARKNGRAVIWSMGAHVIRRGLGPHIVELARRGFLTHVATNGAGAIHDFEFALIGATTESVARYIDEGQFGLWEETGGGMNGIFKHAAQAGEGAGGALGRAISEDRFGMRFPHKEISVFAGLYRANVPATIHIAIGQDIIHEHPACDGAALGAVSYRDFLLYTKSMEKLKGGVFMNFGSQVMGPEVYLKALAMVRNAARTRGETVDHFVTLNCDLVAVDDAAHEDATNEAFYYYRPKKTILVRSLGEGCMSFHVQGDHRATCLHLFRMLTSEEEKK